MGANPMSKISERANRAISSHVEMQLRDQAAAMNERLDRLEESVAALHSTLATLQNVSTEMSSTFSDRIRTIEHALQQARNEAGDARLG